MAGLRARGADAQRHTEDLMGEVDERKTRLSTNIKCPSTLDDITQILAGLANLQGLVKVWATITPGSKGPFIYWVARDLMTLLTSLDFRRAYALNFPAKQPHLLHFLVAVVDKVLHSLSLWSQRFTNVRRVANGKWDELDTTAIQQTEEAYAIDRQRLIAFTAGDTVPITQTWTGSKEEKEVKDREEAKTMAKYHEKYGGGGRKRGNSRPALGSEPDDKRRQTTLGEAASRSKSKEGPPHATPQNARGQQEALRRLLPPGRPLPLRRGVRLRPHPHRRPRARLPEGLDWPRTQDGGHVLQHRAREVRRGGSEPRRRSQQKRRQRGRSEEALGEVSIQGHPDLNYKVLFLIMTC